MAVTHKRTEGSSNVDNTKKKYDQNDYLFQQKTQIEEALALFERVKKKELKFKQDLEFEVVKNKKGQSTSSEKIAGFFDLLDEEEQAKIATAFENILLGKKDEVSRKINEVFSFQDGSLKPLDLMEDVVSFN